MKKQLFNVLLLILITVQSAIAQNLKQIPQAIADRESKNVEFHPLQLFSNQTSYDTRYHNSLKGYQLLQVNKGNLLKLKQDKPEHIEISIPFEGKNIEVLLYRASDYLQDLIATDQNKNPIDYELGAYYKGIIKGDYHSLVSISFFDNDIIGVISSTSKNGNIVIAKTTEGDLIAYNDLSIKGENYFNCGYEKVSTAFAHQAQQQVKSSITTNNTMTSKCVRVYYELCYNVLTHFGTEQATMNFITAIQNNIQTLYQNDNINLQMSEVSIWTTQDPYTGDYQENLFAFQQNATFFNGDLAHLVKFPAETSVAFINSLCTNNRKAFSGIDPNFNQIPTYSWTIMAMTHEMGHSLGSPHTHDCFWNGNNTAIDSCYTITGDCPEPGIPSNGGTIMSYCHMQDVGVNFANGFGLQPAQLIRDTVNDKICLSSDCSFSCEKTLSNFSIIDVDNTTLQFNFAENNEEGWLYRLTPYGQQPGNWNSTNSQSNQIENLAPNSYYFLEVTPKCDETTGGFVTSTYILTGTYCDDAIFTDMGGLEDSYPVGVMLFKTFYPSQPDAKVKINFEYLELTNPYDVLMIGNGTSIYNFIPYNNGYLSGSLSNVSFTSDSEDGSISVYFFSNTSNVGWKANVQCNITASNESFENEKISIYPNPTKNILNINSEQLIESYSIYDVNGKRISHGNSNTKQFEINVEHLASGTYQIQLKTSQGEISKKFVKQ